MDLLSVLGLLIVFSAGVCYLCVKRLYVTVQVKNFSIILLHRAQKTYDLAGFRKMLPDLDSSQDMSL